MPCAHSPTPPSPPDESFALRQSQIPVASFNRDGSSGPFPGAGMKQGEVEFPGLMNHRAYYLVCPEGPSACMCLRVCVCACSRACVRPTRGSPTHPPIHPSTHPPSHPRAHPLVHPHATCNIIAKYAMTNEKNMMIYTHRSCNYNTQMTKIVPINAKHTKNLNIQILYFCVATSAHKSTDSVLLCSEPRA